MRTKTHIDVAVPDGICGKWRVESFTVSPEDAEWTKLRAALNGRDEYVPPGTYKRLVADGVVVMSNTPMEVRTNDAFIRQAKGRVLINGLGLGMVLTAILRKPDIESVTVIEASAEVIALVAPSFQTDRRVRITHGCAFDYKPAKEDRFDAVWHDIWSYIEADNIPEMDALEQKYAQHTDWQASWCRWQCKRLALSSRYTFPMARNRRSNDVLDGRLCNSESEGGLAL